MKFSRTSASRGPGSPDVTGFYDDDTGSIQYLVSDPDTGKAALIDVVLTFNHQNASTDAASVEKILRFAGQAGLEIVWMLSPGHTLGSITYVVGDDAAFVHDTFMQPDAGTSRADFPGGSADDLYNSLQDILALPDHTRLFIGHDYGTKYRPGPEWESTVAEQRRHNIHIGGGTPREDYTKQRSARDKTLVLPDRMLHVLQMNLRAGALPEAENDGNRYLKIPMNKV